MNFLQKAIEISKNEYASIVSEGIIGDKNSIFYDTGSYTLNAVLSADIYGGIPSNKIVAFAGENAVGKTFIAISVAVEFLKRYKDAYIMYFESEGAITKKMLVDRGLDVERTALLPVATIEEFRTQVKKILSAYKEEKNPPKFMIILDSLGNLSTIKETEDIESGKDKRDMTRTQLIKATFRVLTLQLSILNIPMIVTNHVYENIGSMGYMPVIGGGSGIKYCSSNIVYFGKRKQKSGDVVIGNIIPVTLLKGRFTKENTKVLMSLKYKGGLDKYYGLIELALRYDLVQKSGTRIEIDGKKVFEKYIYDNPDEFFTKEFLDQINKNVKKDFVYE